ncbi:MAG: hypothetical protein J6B75_02790 [Ruminococcus sp.]|nr:hypothetical protein [Ruminococcus sp.]
MERIIVAVAGGLAALGGTVFLIKLLILRLGGVRTAAEVVAVKEPKQGYYVHTLRFEHNGKTVEQDDKTGYSQPFSKGERLEIVCSRSSPEIFEYTSALNKNLIISGVLIAMAVLIVIRFVFFVV